MPSLEHNALVELFRDDPALAHRLLRHVLGVTVPAHSLATVAEAALDQLIPTEFRADLVVELRDAAGVLLLAIIVEVQLGVDPDKRYTWPVYVAALRARLRVPVCVLAIAPAARVAAWAAEPIVMGPATGSFTAVVIGPTAVPRVTDAAMAVADPALAVLSARAHGNDADGLPVVLAALSALDHVDAAHAAVYLHVVYEALHAPVRAALEAWIMEHLQIGDAPLPPFAQRLKAEGKVEGKIEGKAEGMAEGKAEGMAEGKREVLFKLVANAGFALTDDQRVRIAANADVATLDAWIDRVLAGAPPDTWRW